MIAPLNPPSSSSPLDPLQAAFLTLLPRIQLHGRVYFRHLKCLHKKEDALQEMAALAWKWFRRLAQRGKDASAFPSALASYAAKAVNSGRRAVGQEKASDVLSPLAQQRHRFVDGKLPEFETLCNNPLMEALVDNTMSPVPQQVCFRLDFPPWLVSLGQRNRAIAEDMAQGHRTQELAQAYQISEGRISQLRRQFERYWQRYDASPHGGGHTASPVSV